MHPLLHQRRLGGAIKFRTVSAMLGQMQELAGRLSRFFRFLYPLLWGFRNLLGPVGLGVGGCRLPVTRAALAQVCVAVSAGINSD